MAAAAAAASSAVASDSASSADFPDGEAASASTAAVAEVAPEAGLPFGIAVDPSWEVVLGPEMRKPYFRTLWEFVESERAAHTVFPARNDVFAAFRLMSLNQVKVVIVGQDPYHGRGQAHGLAFSVPPGIAQPPSLRNICKEVADDMGLRPSRGGCLEAWARQGVLLLNTALTVREATPMSHAGKGWETLTSAVITYLATRREGLVFLLWGKPAQKAAACATSPRHCRLEAAHPSPLSAHRGFFGCKHFSKANTYLEKRGSTPIDWSIPTD